MTRWRYRIDYISYSQLNTYEQCPRQWYLSRIAKGRERQTWYLPMGTVVHTIIEHKVKTGEELEFEPLFYAKVREQRKIEPDTVNWLAGGPKDAPFMRDKVVDMGKACIENAFKFLEKFKVLHVEYDLSGHLPGCTPLIKGYGDLIGEHDDHGYLIVDAKTSATKPKNDLQLETYNALLVHNPHPEVPEADFRGYWLMLRPDAKPKTDKARLVEWKFTPEELGRRYQAAYEKMQAMEVPATSTFCDFCTQKPNCLAQSGPTQRAKYYDKSESDGIPF